VAWLMGGLGALGVVGLLLARRRTIE
jgi:hypothetical protein